MYSEVYLFDLPYHLDRAFDYLSIDGCEPGAFVKVPFGRANTLRAGIVMSVKDTTESQAVKPVHSVIMEGYALTERMHGLCLFLKEHTLCTVGEAVRCMLPPGAFRDKENLKLKRTCTLLIPREEAATLLMLSGRSGIRSEGQRRALTYLLDIGSCDYELLRTQPSVTSANIRALAERGIIRIDEGLAERNPYAALSASPEREEIVLSRQQNEAFSKIEALLLLPEARCALLHGVTGSGKTKVIMKAIDRCIDAGQGVIMMVPEISLTPQTVGIFCKRYGNRVAVVHSSLSEGERQDAYRKIRRGEVDLVIGTRSAVFAPLPNIGMIVIDEEHEHTYKSESDPKYHARDVASYLCAKEGALLLLASATPSLESYYKANNGAYSLIKLTERYGGVSLPTAVIVDMREELRLGNITPISARLQSELTRVYESEEQAIIFLNRRGYHSQVQCKSCGEVISCPRCSVSMTHHTSSLMGSKMLCHLCGYSHAVPKRCPSCGEDKLSFLGFGTQKLESELNNYLPDMRIMRMDADTTSGKLAYDRLLEEFRGEGADILLGTQMVAKGHDFPKVTLVGAALADSSLFVSDFRAAERTFSLLTQVIGRAGRAKDGGVAVIQTYAPKNEIIRLACEQNYEKFYEGEIAKRRELLFPPFCDIAVFTVTSDDESAAIKHIGNTYSGLLSMIEGELSKLPFVVYGPIEAGVYKLNDKYRMKLVVKCRLNKTVRSAFSRLLCEATKTMRDATLSVDFNPIGGV